MFNTTLLFHRMVLYILTSYRMLGIVDLDQLYGACHTHLSFHDGSKKNETMLFETYYTTIFIVRLFIFYSNIFILKSSCYCFSRICNYFFIFLVNLLLKNASWCTLQCYLQSTITHNKICYVTVVQTFHSFVIKIMTLYLPQYFFPLMHFAISKHNKYRY